MTIYIEISREENFERACMSSNWRTSAVVVRCFRATLYNRRAWYCCHTVHVCYLW